ncbi:MAG TPA: 50S ribosomal protein L35, partial [Acidimicrobiia bacterium]|nr:50S ribosomal protein L35 [Acidimicrobiia bacterium]
MAKQKTRRSAAKRFQVTGSGKILRRQAYRSHLVVGNKSSSRLRRLKGMKTVSSVDEPRVKKMLGK